MNMNTIAGLGLLATLLGACADQPHAYPHELDSLPRVWVGIEGFSDDAHVSVCADFRVHYADDDGTTLASTGDPNTRAQTVEEALQDGAVCAPVRFGRSQVAFSGPCDPARGMAVSVVVEGVYYDGVRAERAELDCSTAQGGCTRTFACERSWPHGAAVSVNLGSVWRGAAQGFFDLGVDTVLPPLARDVCVDLRITNRKGEAVAHAGDPRVAAATAEEAKRTGSLCASDFGNLRESLSYVTPCDAELSDNTVTLWFKGVYFDENTPPGDRAWKNPCAAWTIGDDPSAWNGGCQTTHACTPNADSTVDLSADLVSGSF